MKRFLFILSVLACVPVTVAADSWQDTLAERLPLLGHRNWIVIADSAYPLQIAPGVETIETGAAPDQVLKTVLAAVDGAPHIRANVFTDSELAFVPEADAPGVSAYRTKLKAVLAGHNPASLPHGQMIQQLAQAGATFKVLLLKTNLTIPYTTVFLQLDCRYWSDAAEARLRSAMENAK